MGYIYYLAIMTPGPTEMGTFGQKIDLKNYDVTKSLRTPVLRQYQPQNGRQNHVQLAKSNSPLEINQDY